MSAKSDVDFTQIFEVYIPKYLKILLLIIILYYTEDIVVRRATPDIKLPKSLWFVGAS